MRTGEFACACLAVLVGLSGVSPAENVAETSLTWIWANPSPHGNNLIDMAYTNGLYVQIAERGQLYTSLDLELWMPRDTHTTNALRAALFFRDRLLVTGEQGTILAADVLTNDLANFRVSSLGTADWLEGLAASPDMLVAVGDHAAIYTSLNGTNWSRRQVPFSDWLRSVAYGGNGFVSVGENGLIAVSANATNWQTAASGTLENLNKVAWIGDRYWAVGDAGTTLASTNGRSWTAVNSGATNDLFAVTGNSESQLLVGDNELRLLQKSASRPYNYVWSNELDPAKATSAPSWTYYSALWNGASFLLGGRTGLVVAGARTNASTSSYIWVPLAESVHSWFWDLVHVPGLNVAVGDLATIMTSTDGASWSLEYIPESVTNRVLLGIGGDQNGLVAVGSRGTILYSPSQFTNVLATNLVNGTLVITTNTVNTLGFVWQAVSPVPTANDLQGICLYQNQWIVTGGEGTVLTSADATHWTLQPTPATTILSSVAASSQGYVAVGDLGTILTSSDGVTWTLISSGTTNWIYRVRCLGNTWVAVGQKGTLLTSTNRVVWSAQNTGTGRWLNDVAFFAGTYYAVGTQGTVITSPDLVTWNFSGSVSGKSLFGLAVDGHQLLAAGIEGVLLRAQTAAVQTLSYDRQSPVNSFLFSGKAGSAFTIDDSGDLHVWNTGARLQFLDNSGLLRHRSTNSSVLPQEFYRPSPRP